jgi:assimilatory nitrate reductase catalytic subunit
VSSSSRTGDQITGVRGDPDHPANFGRLCTKGSTLALTASAAVTRQTRLLQPMRREHRHEAPKPVSWDSALAFASESFAQIIREHGPDAVGFYISGQLLTEDYYVFNKLAKGLIGTNNVDTNSRLCMSSAVAGYKQTLGADAPPSCYDDVNHAQCIFIVGSNTAYAHPILFRRIEDAKAANPALKIIFCDPRRTDTAEIADLYLGIQPGTDVSLFNGMLHIMLWEGWTDAAYIAAHTTGFDALKATVRDYTPDLVAETCGIKKEDLLAAAKLFATSAATLSLYCQGLNQSSSGTAKNAALINLHLATGQIGKPGAGPFLADRPAQCHGRARSGRPGQPAERAPRPGQSRNTAPKSPRCGACRTCPKSRARRPSRCSRPPPTARSRHCGSPAPTRHSPCPTRPRCAARWSAPNW